MAEPGGGERRCNSCGELSPTRAKFCLECGQRFAKEFESTPDVSSGVDLVDRLPQASGAAGERRIASVLFADLSGFTAFSEGSDVEDVRAIAQEAAGRLGDIVVKYGGTVDKIIGDCVMAVFGAPVAHEDDPERAVRAALEMQTSVAENRERFGGMKLCVGVNTGEVIYSEVGSDGYTVLGDTVNTAARLQTAAAKDTVCIGQPTYTAVADVIECELLEPIKAKNKSEPVLAWRAVSVKGERTRYKPVQAALVGREEEFERLSELWELVRTEHRPYTVALLGAAGIGKSRLINAFTDDIGASALVLRGRCLPYGEGITYWPVIQIIQQVAGIHHDDSTETVSQKLGVLLEGLGTDDLDELRTIAVALANLIGAPTTPRGTYTATQISKGELHWGLRRILELGARNVPLVLIIEDLHWADPTLIELITYIFESRDEAPILGIGSARPEFTETGDELLAAKPNRRVLELASLGDDDARRIVTELVGTDVLPTAAFADLLHSAGGNPLFLEEIAQIWRDAGGVVEDMVVPSGLQALIDSRLDRLEPDERRLISRAAVIGDVFWSGSLTVLGDLNSGLDDVLDALESRDLIRKRPSSTVSGEHEYEFKHGLIRDVAYARLTKSERASLHERCGEWISRLPGGDQEFAEIVAYHLEQACRIAADLALKSARPPTLTAARALVRAADKAEAREGIREGQSFLSRALELLGDRFPETAIEVRLQNARMLAMLGDIESAIDHMRVVAEAGAELDRPDVRCKALVSLAEGAVMLGQSSEAGLYLDEAEALERTIDEPSLRIRVGWIRATVHQLFDAQPEKAAEMLRSAIALAEEIDDSESVLTGRMRLGAHHYNVGDLPDAQREFERCVELAQEQGSLRLSAWLTAFLGLLRYHCGPRQDADTLYGQALEWFERTDDRFMQIQTIVWRAALALDAGDVRFAVQILRDGQRLVREIGGAFAVYIDRYLAEAFARQGRVGEAREVAEAARDVAPEEDPLAQAGALVAEAFASEAEADEPAARQRFAQAFAILDKQGSRVDLAQARLAFARLLEGWGDCVSATDQLERARENFEETGAVASVAEIDSWVARMTEDQARPEPTGATA